MIYDVIGDVHGKAMLLKKLLLKLGYHKSHSSGAYTARDRRAVFVGDLIDRGEEELETVTIVRKMVDDANAVCLLGNHEFNAVCYATEIPGNPGRYLRKHSAQNERSHSMFLKEFGDITSPLHRQWVDWFKTLPMWYRGFDFLTVHACFDPVSMTICRAATDGTLCLEGARKLRHLSSPRWEEGRAAQILLKGPDARLPFNLSFKDKSGNVRHKVRIRWWQARADNIYDDVISIVCTDEEREFFKKMTPPWHRRNAPDPGCIVFIGHYWMPPDEEPRPLSPNVICTDYSAGIGGPLCAYSHETGHEIELSRFTRVFP